MNGDEVVISPSLPQGLLRGLDPVTANAEVEAIAIAGGGIVTPEAVVEAARHPGNPLHRFFEWDDTKAAQRYRLQQARHLLTVIHLKPLQTASTTVITVRAWPHVPGIGGGYRAQAEVAASPDLSLALVEGYERSLRSLHQRHTAQVSVLKASRLGPVVKAIEQHLKNNP